MTDETRERDDDARGARLTIRIDRFEVPVRLAVANACGSHPGSFYAEIELTARRLDAKGFVVDNDLVVSSVVEAFGSGMFAASCEQVAGGIVNLCHRMTGDRLIAASVRVFNKRGSAHAQWDFGDVVPPFPRLATQSEVDATNAARMHVVR